MDTDNNIGKDNNGVIKKLKRKINYLRIFTYLFFVICILLIGLVIFWSQRSSVETFYSVPPQPPQAALYLSPEQGNYKVGDEFSVDVLVNTAGSDVVVAAAHLSYNKNYMKALSIDTSRSLFQMTAENDINIKDGKIKITLGKPTPGVKASSGLVATIHFKALEKVSPYFDNIYFDFTKGSSLYSTVILDDQKGTNILNMTRGAKIFIN